jgi:hypothetical protein
MSEADLFRQFADEAKQGSSPAINEDEKMALAELAAIWTKAAMLSERLFVKTLLGRRARVANDHFRIHA